MATILTVGSSTTYGIGDPEGGWAGLLQSEMLARLADELDARIAGDPAPDKRVALVHNLALVAGLTFPENVESMPMYVRGLDRETGRKLVIAMVGSNDHAIPEGSDEPLVSLPIFERSLDRFGELCAEFGLISMFVEVCPIDPSRPRPYNRGDINPDRLGAYQQAVREHAHSVDARFIPTHDALKQLDQDPIGMDGIHPSPAANRKVFELVLTEVDDILSTNTKPVAFSKESHTKEGRSSIDLPDWEVAHFEKLLEDIGRKPAHFNDALDSAREFDPRVTHRFHRYLLGALATLKTGKTSAFGVPHLPEPLPLQPHKYSSLVVPLEIAPAIDLLYKALGGERPALAKSPGVERTWTETESGIIIQEFTRMGSVPRHLRHVPGWVNAEFARLPYIHLYRHPSLEPLGLALPSAPVSR
jgi:hypothetical protein